jgi:hypothetical protein
MAGGWIALFMALWLAVVVLVVLVLGLIRRVDQLESLLLRLRADPSGGRQASSEP